MRSFSCRICKKVRDYIIIDEFTAGLPEGMYCIQCRGCGVMGVELLGEPDA